MPIRRRKSIRSDQTGAMASQILGLSLFVMLLAFFIVLNSISTFDEAKVAPLRQSLEQTFATMLNQSGNLNPSIVKSSDMAFGEGTTLEQIEGLFKSQITGMESVTSTARGTLYVRVPKGDFEAIVNGLGDKKPAKATQGFIAMLVSVLRSEERGAPYRVDIVYNLDENPARIGNREPAKMTEAIKGAAAIAGKIEAAGLPQKLMTIGLQKGDSAFIEMTFSRHIPFDPAGGAHDE